MPTTAKGTPYVVSTDLVANYPTVSSDLADHIDDNLAYNAVSINAQTGSGANAYTFALADASEGKLVTAANAAAATYTVPPQSAVTWASGAVLRILNQGAGVVTIAAGSGVTINGAPLTLNQYQSATIVRTASNTWTILPQGTAGKILQVVRATDTTNRTTTSGSYVDANLSVTISPTRTSSNIIIVAIVRAQIVGSGSNQSYGSLIITDSSNNTISGAQDVVFGTSVDSTVIHHMNIWAYASPNTLSATTYKLRMSSVIATNRTLTLSNASNTAQMYAIEVGA